MDSGVVQSNWRTKEEKNVKDCVQWCLGNQSSDVEDAVQVENCIMLEPTDDASSMFASPACQLLLTCPENFEMRNISILSEARIIEVFGHHGEYLKTCRSELVEEVDDMAVFRTEITFDKPVTICSLKFTSLKSKKSMWLYGVRVILHPMIIPHIGSKIPLEDVKQRLGNMGSKLSDRAEAFKQLVGNYQSTQNLGNEDFSTLSPGMFQLLKMFNLAPKSQNGREFIGDSLPSSRCSDHGDWRKQSVERKSVQSEELNDNLTSNRDKILDANSNLETNSVTDNENMKQKILMEENLNEEKNRQDYLIKNLEEKNLEILSKLIEKSNEHVEKQLEEFQKRLWEKTERRLQELEQKILCKLDEILTFIKPQGIAR